ncbi:unnamed protein product [Cyprideis torosa]|uniref:Uncharacterized protein n=1 Tax=Cyprideis torosa TaxID=163714 RepID=A0A7R8ZNK2_9CRUS|nr:unnamed protein product [Cyprideis torosa]CAG0886562.1 unnamed protein product [Cyprideis torosa]
MFLKSSAFAAATRLVKDAWKQISLDEIKASIDQFLPRVQEIVNQQGGPIQHELSGFNSRDRSFARGHLDSIILPKIHALVTRGPPAESNVP